MKSGKFSAEAAVVGGGPSGLIAAIALASGGAETLLVAPKPPHPDRRTTALLDGSVQALTALGAWDALSEDAAALRFLRIVDGSKRLLRTPEVLFDSAELGLEAFGYNVENERMREILLAMCRKIPTLRLVEEPVTAVMPDEAGVTLALGENEERVRVVAAADGRKSICRTAAGIETRARRFPQTAIVLNLRHTVSHNDTSTEFHTETGPFTLAPLKGNRSSLVCVVAPDEAETLAALNDEDLGYEVEMRAHSILGKMRPESARGIFPLGSEIAVRFAARRIGLIGEAGHVFPPIGAQGLNLGIRDAVTFADVVNEARRMGRDPGGDDVLEHYDHARSSDIRGRSAMVDFANRSLLTDFLPVHAARGLGLHFASKFGFFRRTLMRQGLGPVPLLSRAEERL